MTLFIYSKLVKVLVVFFRFIFLYNYVFWNLQKKLWYVIWSNVCFIFMWLSLSLTVLILILHFQNSHWGLTSNRMLTREIRLLASPRDLMPERLLFLKIKVITFFSNYIYQKIIFTICILSKNIFIRSLRFVCTLHSNIYQTQFPGKEI